jgi:hypothetical protein
MIMNGDGKMAYNVLDLLDKAINIAEKRKKIYNEELTNISKDSSLYILMNVLIKNVDRTIEYLEKLKLETDNLTGEEIDFDIYDKISFLINEFNQKLFIPENLNIKTLLESSLDIEKNVLALYIDIQGRLVKKKEDTETNVYKLLSRVILQKEKKIKDLQTFIKTYSL